MADLARRIVTPLLLAAGAGALLAGIAGGLLRAGLSLPAPAPLAFAAALHGVLMLGCGLGTVVTIERAVALRQPAGWIAPACAAAAAPLLLAGAVTTASLLLLAAAAAFVPVNIVLVRRQPAAHTALLLVAALAWLAGNALWAAGWPVDAALPWWFAFVVVTIAAERLEMTRLMRRRPAAQPLLAACLAVLLAGAGLVALWPSAGAVVYGTSLLALASWLLRFDIARRTIAAPGLPRYMAACLLAGYAWLAAAGAAWIAMAFGHPTRDAALHALGLGFIGSMVLGHAPVILPAVARVKLAFGRAFYLPLLLLHGSLLVRLAGGAIDATWLPAGAAANAAALALFAATTAGAAFAWRWRQRHPTTR